MGGQKALLVQVQLVTHGAGKAATARALVDNHAPACMHVHVRPVLTWACVMCPPDAVACSLRCRTNAPVPFSPPPPPPPQDSPPDLDFSGEGALFAVASTTTTMQQLVAATAPDPARGGAMRHVANHWTAFCAPFDMGAVIKKRVRQGGMSGVEDCRGPPRHGFVCLCVGGGGGHRLGNRQAGRHEQLGW